MLVAYRTTTASSNAGCTDVVVPGISFDRLA